MNKAKVIFFAAAFVATGAFATDDMKQQGVMMDVNAMDTNHDGMISKKEFMKYHENMWAKMKKNKAALVDMRDMEMMRDSVMKDGMMTKDKAGK
jgi:chitinase